MATVLKTSRSPRVASKIEVFGIPSDIRRACRTATFHFRSFQQLHSLNSDKTSVGAPSEGTVVRDVLLELAAEDRVHLLLLFIDVLLLLLWPLSVVVTVSSKSSTQTQLSGSTCLSE